MSESDANTVPATGLDLSTLQASFNLLSETMQLGIFLTDREGTLLYWNSRLESLMRNVADLSLGMKLEHLEGIRGLNGESVFDKGNREIANLSTGERIVAKPVNLLTNKKAEQLTPYFLYADPVFNPSTGNIPAALWRLAERQDSVGSIGDFSNIISSEKNLVQAADCECGKDIAVTEEKQALLPAFYPEKEIRIEPNYDQIPVASFIIDLNGHFIRTNRCLLEKTGYDDDDFQHMDVFDLFPRMDRWEISAWLEKAKNIEAQPGDIDVFLITQSGDQLPLNLRSALIPYSEKPAILIIGVELSNFHDILSAKTLNEERLTLSQSFANIGLWDWNLKTDDIFWSDRVGELVGSIVTPGKFGFQELVDAAHSLDRSRLSTSIANCASGNDVLDEEFRIQRADGNERWMLARGNLMHDSAGSAIRMLGIIQDITPLKHAEFLEKQAREQVQSIIDSLEAAICVVDAKGEILSVNRAWQRYLYQFSDGVLAPIPNSTKNYFTFCELLSQAGQTDLHKLAANVRAVLAGANSSIESEIIITPQENEQTYLVRVNPLQGSNKLHPLVVINHQNVSVQRKVEQDLIHAKEDAERASRTKSEFLSLMSHELRTPMNAVLGFAQLLAQDPDLTEDQSESVKEILIAGEHLLQLINEVLDLARVEAGRIELEITPIPLSDLATECLPLISVSARTHEVTVSVGSLTDMAVLADRVRLKQVLINLLSNAVKYNKPGGSVFLQATRLDERLIRIEVRDTGFGIPKDALEGLFDPFSRLERDVHREGTGIGLAVCRQLVTAMGGKIQASSHPEEGSCFWLELPAATVEVVADDNLSARLLLDPSEKTDVKSIRVLQIEDNPANLKLLEQAVGRVPNFVIASAASGRAGLELAESFQPDVVLLDIQMPEMNGYEVLRCLREDLKMANIPVIAVSANAADSDIETGLLAGFNAYITKPIDLLELRRTIERLVEGEG